jgi:hypothetical protein
MRRLAIFTLVLATAGLTLVLSSCSSPITPLSTASVPSIIGLQQSSNTEMLGMLAPSSSYAPMALSPQQLSKAGLQTQSLACVQSVNWGANVDGDLAPVSGTITYGNCTGITSITASGTFTIADTNDNDPYSGFNAALNGFTMTASTTTLSMNGSLDVLRTSVPPSPNYDINYQLAINITVPSVSGSVNVSGTPTFASTVTGTTNPWVSGTFTLNGTATFDTSNGYHYSLTRTGAGVVNTSACVGSFATNSAITYTDSQGNTLALAYTGCGTGNWTLTASGGATSTGTF